MNWPTTTGQLVLWILGVIVVAYLGAVWVYTRLSRRARRAGGAR